MNISMIGIDCSKASIQEREKFSLTVSQGAKLGKRIVEEYGASGCVILSTCNRTELWFSGLEASPWEVLIRETGSDREAYGGMFMERSGREAAGYLFELACGMHSQIFGEDQILTQVKAALQNAREAGHTDQVLETLFRLAITGAKRVKSEVRLTNRNSSVPDKALELLEQETGELAGKRCLVIGNGEIGQLMAEKLVASRCSVTMTLRQYRKAEVRIPDGVTPIAYDRRYSVIGEMDFIFSGTLSPHLTVRKEDLCGMEESRTYRFMDLAVPRDIDPEIGNLPYAKVYDMDDLGTDTGCGEAELQKSAEILETYREEFFSWYRDRDYRKAVHHIGTRTGKLADAKLTREYRKIQISREDETELRKSIQAATQKSVEKLMFAAKDHMDEAQWHQCIKAFHKVSEEME